MARYCTGTTIVCRGVHQVKQRFGYGHFALTTAQSQALDPVQRLVASQNMLSLEHGRGKHQLH